MSWGLHPTVPWEDVHDDVVSAYRLYDMPVMVTNKDDESFEGVLVHFSDHRSATLRSNGVSLIVSHVARIELSE